jgi:hypothetical protein
VVTVGTELVKLELPRPLETENSPHGSWRDLEPQSGNRVVFRHYLCVDLGGIDECLRACAHCRRWSIRAETDSTAELSKGAHDSYVSEMEAGKVRSAIQMLPIESREVIFAPRA